MKTNLSRQRGASLFIGLVMLLVLTLATVVAFSLSKGSLQIVGNMQHRNEVLSAANSAAEEAMSSSRLYTTPGSVLLNPCNGVLNQRCYDVNGDGINDVTVNIMGPYDPSTDTYASKPGCVEENVLKNSNLNLSDPNFAGCAVGASQTTGVVGSDTGNSLCAYTVWEIDAVATDTVTQTKGTVTLGVSTLASTTCP